MSQDSSSQRVNIHKLEQKFKSKKELYHFLQQDGNAYLPNLDSTNVYFLKQILKGEKEYLKREDVKISAVPQIEGLTSNDFLQYVSDKESLKSYLPDQSDWVHLDKKWICNVLYTLDTEGIQDMIKLALTERKDKLEDKRNLTIQIRPEFMQALDNCLTFSTQKGRSVALLKDSSRRKRKREELNEVKQEENQLKQDKQAFLQEFKRLKQNYEQIQPNNNPSKKDQTKGQILFQQESQEEEIKMSP